MRLIKAAIMVSLIMACFITAEAQKKEPDSKIKSIVVSEEKYDVLVKKQYKESETYYDSRGNVTESITYKDGKVDKHFKYEYDSDNNKIREEEYETSGRLKETSEYKYVNGLRTEKNVFDPNHKQKSKKTYVYTSY